LAVVVGGGWAVARSTAWATRIGWMGAGIARWWRAGCAARRRLRCVVVVGAQGRVAWSLRASWAGLRFVRAAVVRPQHAASAACSTLATL
jgi:hypothetical protein